MVCFGGISRAGSFWNVLCRKTVFEETIRCLNVGVIRSSKWATSTKYPNSNPGQTTTTLKFFTMATVISGNVLGEAQVSSPNKKLKFEEGMDVENGGGKENKETKEVLRFVKMTDKAHAPTKGSKFSAGFDLMSAYEYVVPARGSCLVKTDIQIQLPHGTYGRVAPRSGLALKHKIDVGAGVIDEDYRGNVGVILFNFSDQDFKVAAGDRIAQLICERIAYPDLVEMESLDDSERGAGGFGSTGTKSA